MVGTRKPTEPSNGPGDTGWSITPREADRALGGLLGMLLMWLLLGLGLAAIPLGLVVMIIGTALTHHK